MNIQALAFISRYLVKTGAALLLVSLYSGQGFAAGRWYQVELIVFQQHGATSERFYQTAHQIAWPSRLVELSGHASLQALQARPVSYRKINSADWSMHWSERQLRRAGYAPILHVSWLQQVGKNRLSNAVHIYTTDGQGDYPLNGFVRIQRGNYLHLLVDLEYTRDIDDSGDETYRTVVYRLQEKRRIKLNEIHYLDHPRFAVIAEVKPIAIGH